MTSSSERLQTDDAADAVVHPLSRVSSRPCSRPGCPAPARATLMFAYAQRQAWMTALQETDEPQAYDLCAPHAARTRPPYGWQMRDRRPQEDRHPDPPTVAPTDLGGERTVAVLAAALRAVPDIPPERDVVDPPATDPVPTVTGAAAAAAEQPELPAPAAAGSTSGDRRYVTRPPLAVREDAG